MECVVCRGRTNRPSSTSCWIVEGQFRYKHPCCDWCAEALAETWEDGERYTRDGQRLEPLTADRVLA